MTRVAGDIQSSSRWNSGGRRLVLKPLMKPDKVLGCMFLFSFLALTVHIHKLIFAGLHNHSLHYYVFIGDCLLKSALSQLAPCDKPLF